MLALNAQIMMPSGGNLLSFPYLKAGKCLDCSTFCVQLQQARAPKHVQFQHLCFFSNFIRRRHVYCAIDDNMIRLGLKVPLSPQLIRQVDFLMHSTFLEPEDVPRIIQIIYSDAEKA